MDKYREIQNHAAHDVTKFILKLQLNYYAPTVSREFQCGRKLLKRYVNLFKNNLAPLCRTCFQYSIEYLLKRFKVIFGEIMKNSLIQ